MNLAYRADLVQQTYRNRSGSAILVINERPYDLFCNSQEGFPLRGKVLCAQRLVTVVERCWTAVEGAVMAAAPSFSDLVLLEAASEFFCRT